MKYTIVILAAIITIGFLFSCNGGGSVGAYTSTGKNDTASNTNNTEPGFAKTDRGREIFETRCIACHGQNGNACNDNAANLQMSVLDSLGMTQTIKNGRGAMPMFKDVIADTDMAHLVVYVKSLRSNIKR